MVSDRLNVKHEICDYDEDSSSPTSYDFIPKSEKSEKVRTSGDRSGKHSPINHYKSLKLEKDIKPEDYESDHRQETSERFVVHYNFIIFFKTINVFLLHHILGPKNFQSTITITVMLANLMTMMQHHHL